MGHKYAFTPPGLSARCRFSQRTFAGTLGYERGAPKAVIGGAHSTVGFNPGHLQGNKSGTYGPCSPAATTRQGCP